MKPQVTEAHRALAAKINDLSNYTADGVPEADIAQWIAEHDAAILARAEAAEALVSEKDKALATARDEIAAWRKEQADEASSHGAESPYTDGNYIPDYVVAASP